MTTATPIPSRAELEGQVRNWIDACVWRQEVHRAETGGFDYLERDEIERMGRKEAAELDGLLRFAAGIHTGEQQAAIARALEGTETADRFRPVLLSAERQIGASLDPATTAGRLLERTVLRGYATLLDELRETVAAIPRTPAADAQQKSQPAAFVFTAFWDDFEQHKLTNREWKADTAANARGSLNVFDRIFAGVTLSQMAAEPIAAAFKTTLLQLPRHYARGDHASAPIQELVQRGKNLPAADRVQAGTVNKHIANFSEYWTYLIGQKKIPADLKNPFSGLHIPKPKGKRARNERYNWPPSLERTLFESPLYRGCASIHRRTAPGPEIARDALFWMPLLARTMGTRENETCDALVGAVRIEDTQHGPVPYLEITEGKDSGSPRDVPFADLVLDMGFLEQRVIGRDPGEPLFPELIPQGPGQRRSAAFGDRFAYYRRQIKVYRPRVDFHSFRGNVVTDLKNIGGINSAWIDELVGHESTYRRSEGERYTKRIYLPILKNLVNSITIQADFAHLRYVAERGMPAPNRDAELARFVALAKKEMNKKVR